MRMGRLPFLSPRPRPLAFLRLSLGVDDVDVEHCLAHCLCSGLRLVAMLLVHFHWEKTLTEEILWRDCWHFHLGVAISLRFFEEACVTTVFVTCTTHFLTD